MWGLDIGEMALLAMASYLALTTLTRMMQHRRDRIVDELAAQVEAERERQRIRKKKERQQRLREKAQQRFRQRDAA